jgi:hypothetical protein
MQLYDVDMTEVTYHSNMENVTMAITEHGIGDRSFSLRLRLICGIIGPLLALITAHSVTQSVRFQSATSAGYRLPTLSLPAHS